MSAKTILFLGLVISALFIYLCIDSKKNELYRESIKKEKSTPITAIKIPSITKEKNTKHTTVKTEPSFAYISGESNRIGAILSKQDKDSNLTSKIEEICQYKSCITDIQYIEDITVFHFTKDTLGLITYAQKEQIKNFALYIDKKSLQLEGSVQKELESLNSFFETFLEHNYTIENKIKIEIPQVVVKKEPSPKISERIIKEEIIIQTPRDVFVTPMHLSTEEASYMINDIISANNITFDYKSSRISLESKKALDKVIDILLGLDNVNIEIAGYTDSAGGFVYNKVLSQKRADTVRTYLIKSGVRSKLIKSKGYGEENFISEPKDIINRRVEIHLKKEE